MPCKSNLHLLKKWETSTFFFFFQRKKDLFALARVAFSAADLYQKASACNLRGVIIDQ